METQREETIRLNVVQRQFLANQFRLRSKTEPDRSEEFAWRADVLEKGYEGHYADVLWDIREPISQSDCDFVQRVIYMSWLLMEIESVPEVRFDDLSRVQFDEKYETRLYSYARDYLEKAKSEGRYKDVTCASGAKKSIGVVDSRRPMVAEYSRMLDAWMESANSDCPTAEDRDRVLAARFVNEK